VAAVDEDVADADGVGVGLFEGGGVADGGGVEDGDIGEAAGLRRPRCFRPRRDAGRPVS
jgi:hypothetical protein